MSRFATIAGIVAVGVAIATAGAGVSIALAGATPQGYRVPASPSLPVKVEPPKALNLTTLDAINQHLRSRGLNPSTFVVQQGPLNYAGPNCPGAVFNCTTATRVIQIATPDTSLASFVPFGPLEDDPPPNQALCEASPPAEDELLESLPEDAVGCVIVQIASDDEFDEEVDQQASCKVESTDSNTNGDLEKQHCTIVQENETGGDNQATVGMKIDWSGQPGGQVGDQEAVVIQESAGGGDNQAQANETMVLEAEGPETKQDGYQSSRFDQSVSEGPDDEPATGNNEAQATQSEIFEAKTAGEPVAGDLQEQNTTPKDDECDDGGVDEANSCIEYYQYTGSGSNQFQSNQKHDLKATTDDPVVEQHQGCEGSAPKVCGVEETGEQTIQAAEDLDEPEEYEGSKNQAEVVQTGQYTLEGPEGTTAQVQDPRFGGAGTEQVGGADDVFKLTQLAVLSMSGTGDQSHENFVDDQSNGTVETWSEIKLNDEHSVVTCRTESGGRCTYTQRCTNVPPPTFGPITVLENGLPNCPSEPVDPTTTTIETDP